MTTQAVSADARLIDALADETEIEREVPAKRPFVTAERLIALGIFSNSMFWCGMLMPFNAHTMPWVAVLHAFVAMTGLALAFGSAVATVMMVVHQVNTRLFSPQMIAAVMHFTVLIAMATLLASATLRGWMG